jgi:hypothetical protein
MSGSSILVATALGLGIAMSLAVPGDAWAQARNTTLSCAVASSGTSATVAFETKGLGNDNLCYVASSEVSGECVCLSGGGQCPNAANKDAITVEAVAFKNFQSKNGRVSGTLDIAGITNTNCAQDPNLHCGKGQKAVVDNETFGTVHLIACVIDASAACTPNACDTEVQVVSEQTTCVGSPVDFFPQCP